MSADHFISLYLLVPARLYKKKKVMLLILFHEGRDRDHKHSSYLLSKTSHSAPRIIILRKITLVRHLCVLNPHSGPTASLKEKGKARMKNATTEMEPAKSSETVHPHTASSDRLLKTSGASTVRHLNFPKSIWLVLNNPALFAGDK